jgi:hypothetical protein
MSTEETKPSLHAESADQFEKSILELLLALRHGEQHNYYQKNRNVVQNLINVSSRDMNGYCRK